MMRLNVFKIILVLFMAVLFVMNARIMINWQTDLSSPKRDPSCFNQNTPIKPGDKCRPQPTALHAKCQRTLHGIELTKGLVLGKLRNRKVFLSVGFIYTAGQETAVRAALTSIFDHVTLQDYDDITVVVVLSNSDQLEFLKDLQGEFDEFLRMGVLQVISPTEKFYGVVTSWGDIEWKRFSDDFKRSTTEFNMRWVYLMEHCRHVSEFYLQLSSCSRVSAPFLPVIKETAAAFGNTSYGYRVLYQRGTSLLGGLFTQSMVRELAELGAMFPNTGLPSVLLDRYFLFRSSGIKRIPSTDLFWFLKIQQGEKPNAEFYTNFSAAAPDFKLQDAYSTAESYYWAVRPTAGQNFVMVFEKLVQLSRVRISSGTPFYIDILQHGVLRACDGSGTSSRCEDAHCVDIGEVKDTVVDVEELDRKLSFPVKCLQMVITKDHDSWVILRDISLWTQ